MVVASADQPELHAEAVPKAVLPVARESLSEALHALRVLQVLAADSDSEPTGLAAEEEHGPGLISGRFRHPAVVVASADQPELRAEAAPKAVRPVARDFLSEALHALRALQVLEIVV